MPTELTLQVRPETLTCSPLGTISGEAWCQFGDQGFPGIGWRDIPGAVLSAWLKAAASLILDSSGNRVVHFLDGPFLVRVFNKRQDSWQAEFVEHRSSGEIVKHQLEFLPEPFIASLMSCAELFLNECSKRGWKSGDIESITRGLKQVFKHTGRIGDSDG